MMTKKTNTHSHHTQNCCEREVKNRKALYQRSVLGIAVGGLLMFPQIEAIVLHGLLAPYIVPILFVMMGYFLYQDYRSHVWTFVFSGIGFYALLYGPFVFFTPWLSLLGIVAIGFALVGRFTMRFEEIKQGLLSINIDRVIVLMSALSSLISMMHVLGMMAHMGHFMLHETFLAMGAVNYSAYLQAGYKSHHQHSLGIFKNVKEGQIITVEKGFEYCPHTVEVKQGGRVRCDEKVKILDKNQKFEPGEYVSGEVKILKIHPNVVPHQRSEDKRVHLFFLGLMGLVTIVSGVQGVLAHSMLKAIEQFILNMSVLCPCVFLVTKPFLVQSLFQRLQNETPGIDCHKAPSIAQIDTVVFDRTFTLYHPSEEKPEGDFVLHPGAAGLIAQLKQSGKTVYILSGHHTGDWERHRAQCAKDLELDQNHVIFDEKYHDTIKQEKENFIKALQKKGCKVCMVGDGTNDKNALKQADLSIVMRHKRDDANTNALMHANYCISKDSLKNLDKIIDKSTQVVGWINRFSWAAIIYHVAILALVNGGFFLLFSSALPEMVGSIVMSLFCVMSQFLTHKVAGSLNTGSEDQRREHDARGTQNSGKSVHNSCADSNIDPSQLGAFANLVCPCLTHRGQSSAPSAGSTHHHQRRLTDSISEQPCMVS